MEIQTIPLVGGSQRRAERLVPSIPVMSPRLPSADRLLPYLRRIDASRIYTNFGPLVLELEVRLRDYLSLPEGGLVSASSGTAALVAAILASSGRARPQRPLALMPAYTFVATAVAAEQCGFQPCLADIDPRSWMLDPEQLLAHPMLDQIGVVMPVSPFGKGVAQAPWLAFRERTGIPVVIDGAASFEAVSEDPARCLGEIPVIMSFHATKSFATGEGGGVACTDIDMIARVSEALNFGFHASRHSRSASINGKLSEYHAAVGLAEMDGWDAKRAAFARVADSYRRWTTQAGLADRLLVAPEICSSYVLFRCDDPLQSAHVQNALQRDGAEFRLWYGTGLHRHSHFAECPRSDLPVTEAVAPCILGLPLAPDMDTATVEGIVECLLEGIQTGHSLDPEVIKAAQDGRKWPRKWLKQSLDPGLTAEEAFDLYQRVLGCPVGTEVRRKRLRPLHEIAQQRAAVAAAATGSPALAIVPTSTDDRTAVAANSRFGSMVCLDHASVRGGSALIEFDELVLLDCVEGEYTRIDDELELDSAVFRSEGNRPWIITPTDDGGLLLDEAFTLLGPRTSSFGHWLAECLPRYVVAMMSGALPPSVPVLIDQSMPLQHRQALEALLPSGVEVVEVMPGQNVRLQRLWCAYGQALPKWSAAARSSQVEPSLEFVDVISEMARMLRPGAAADVPEKLFIARKPGTHRKLVNHRAIEDLAEKHGFVVVHPEELSFLEQVALAAGARQIVAAEGSGLLLGFFASPGTDLCILHHPNGEALPAVTALMAQMGICCTAFAGTFGRRNEDFLFSDYRIDETGFAALLGRWLTGE